MSKYILAIETSCDETACAIVKDDKIILSNIVSSQMDTHKMFGGVIPEVASRLHVEQITSVIKQALAEADLTVEDMDAIAVTQGPGLIGALHVGVIAAKTLAFYYNKPIIPMHHIAGHIYANTFVDTLEFPLIALVVSGGHTELVYMKDRWSFELLGSTQDDAIGEAYDKVARLLGLGYPGGPIIDKLAKEGKQLFPLPIPKVSSAYDFSFSGLKSAVLQLVNRLDKQQVTYTKSDIAYSFQEAALQQVLQVTECVIQDYQPKHFVLAGGVAANSALRERINALKLRYPNLKITIPPLYCCTDNAAMIAAAASVAYDYQKFSNLNFSALSNKEIHNC